MTPKLRIVCGVCATVQEILPHKIMDNPTCCRQHMLIAGAVKKDIRNGNLVDPVDNIRPTREAPMSMSGKELLHWRTSRYYSLRALANQIGVSASTIQNYESLDEIPRKVELALVALDHLAKRAA